MALHCMQPGKRKGNNTRPKFGIRAQLRHLEALRPYVRPRFAKQLAARHLRTLTTPSSKIEIEVEIGINL